MLSAETRLHGQARLRAVSIPGSLELDARGFRLDVIDAMKRLRTPLIRYTVGNVVSCYDWRDGSGPKDQRPARPDYAWRSVETHHLGVDEFMVSTVRCPTQ